MQETTKFTVLDQNKPIKPNFTSPINVTFDFEQEELQPSLNLGVIGHVSHGKSTVVRALTGKSTAKFHKEHEKNMTIKLGYANCKLWQCTFCKRYFSTQSEVMSTSVVCPDSDCNCGEVKLLRHISFVDCPGHEVLMATMLNGAAVMDASLIVIAADKKCPQNQTKEHLVALDMMGVREFLIVQNKIDLISPDAALANYAEIREFLKATCPRAANSTVVPTCANREVRENKEKLEEERRNRTNSGEQLSQSKNDACHNFDQIYSYLADLKLPLRDLVSPPVMMIVRSFDVNRPGESNIDALQGGIAGGSLLRGVLKLKDEIEIRPGKLVRAKNGTYSCIPLRSKIKTLFSEQNKLQKASPGGLIGVGTNIDPSIAKGDGLVGQVLGLVGHMPSVYAEIEISYILLQRAEENKENKASPPLRLMRGENLRLNIGSLTVDAQVKATKSDLARLALKHPACIVEKSKISLSRKMDNKNESGDKGFRLIGVGQLQACKPLLV